MMALDKLAQLTVEKQARLQEFSAATAQAEAAFTRGDAAAIRAARAHAHAMLDRAMDAGYLQAVELRRRMENGNDA